VGDRASLQLKIVLKVECFNIKGGSKTKKMKKWKKIFNNYFAFLPSFYPLWDTL
jgi:hypothetical protein